MRRLLLAGMVTIVGMVPARLEAQDSIRLRYTPPFGTKIHRVFQTHTRVTTRAAEQGRPTSRTHETVDLGGAVQVALTGPNGESVTHVAFDSLRIRTRDGGGPWHERVVTQSDRLWLQAVVDQRLQIDRLTVGTELPVAEPLLSLVTGLPNFVLPDAWLRSGDLWTVQHSVPLAGFFTRGDASGPPDSLTARTVFQVDSLVSRTGDTLAYLQFTGGFRPVQTTGDAALTYGGGLAGSLVWSSGWSAFVSAAVRFRLNVHVRDEREDETPPELLITLETTTRHQVRPGT